MSEVDDLLNRAKLSIEAGVHEAAEDIAAASEQGATQRKIAEAVGKSAAWVNGLLKWRLAGYGTFKIVLCSLGSCRSAIELRPRINEINHLEILAINFVCHFFVTREARHRLAAIL
jgi:hypothetical protein